MLHEVLSSCPVCKFWKQHVSIFFFIHAWSQCVDTLIREMSSYFHFETNKLCKKRQCEAMRLTRERINFENEQRWRTEPNNKWKSFYTLIKWVTSSHPNIYIHCVASVYLYSSVSARSHRYIFDENLICIVSSVDFQLFRCQSKGRVALTALCRARTPEICRQVKRNCTSLRRRLGQR